MKQDPFTTRHSRRFSWTTLMIVSAEMKHPVHQQHRQLIVDRSSGFLCLANRGRQRNHDIAEHAGHRTNTSRHNSLTGGERQHISRLILLAILTVQPSNTPVSSQFQAQFRSRLSDCRQDTFS